MSERAGGVAVVTGAANGLGFGLAGALGARGMRLVVADIDDGALAHTQAELARDGVEVLAVRTDVTKRDDVTALADATLERFGGVDVVCLNAGVSLRGRAWELTVDDWRWIYDVNVFGVIHGIRSFVPALVEQGRGHVVITASNTAVTVQPTLAPYVSSKHAVLSIAEVLQHDLRNAGTQINVSIALPSAIRSDMADAVRHRPTDYGQVEVAEDLLRASRAFLAEHGADPRSMAEGILRRALDERTFCIFTDPADASTVIPRAEALRDGQLPDVVAPVVLENR